MNYAIHTGDCLTTLQTMPDCSVNTVVTSPPYFGLRDYGVAGQIGMEPTPDDFVERLVGVFREVKRVLREDGTLWLNLGDSYASFRDGKATPDSTRNGAVGTLVPKGDAKNRMASTFTGTSVKHKDLIGIPWRVAFALQADGWYLRCDIIWSKPNPMPESVTDRPTKAHEYLFLLSKSAKYHYDHEAIKESSSEANWESRMERQSIKTVPTESVNGIRKRDKQRGHSRCHAGFNDRWDAMTREQQCSGKRNKRSVWNVATKPFAEAHFATFPPELIRPCILAGCPEGGTVLDPFNGSGTTGVVCMEEGRNYVGIELNPAYVEMATRRIEEAKPKWFGEVEADA